MAYKHETLEKLIINANGLKRQFINIKADLHVCISKKIPKSGK